MDKFRTDKKCVDFLQIDNLTDNLPDPIKPTVSKIKSNDIFECPRKPDSRQTVSFTLVDLDSHYTEVKTEAKHQNVEKIHPDLQGIDFSTPSNLFVKDLIDLSVEQEDSQSKYSTNCPNIQKTEELVYFDAANHSILSDIFENANKKDCHLNFDASYTRGKRFEKHETCELLYISSENKTPTFYEEEVYYEINKSYEIFAKRDLFETSIVIESQAPKYFQIEKQKLGCHEIQEAVSESFDSTSKITPIHICRVMLQNDTFIPAFKTNGCRQIP